MTVTQPSTSSSSPRPYTLIAELTYRCPLACPYCSNPIELRAHGEKGELDTDTWCRVFEEAEALGVVQLHLTGGEPLARKDLERLTQRARELGLYVNLVTSGIPLARERLAKLVELGLDHVQVSIQSTDAVLADVIAGYAGHARKIEVMRWVKALGLPLTMNVVLHRQNLHKIDALVALAEEVGADRLELANTQYLAWALANRDMLLPTREAIERASEQALVHKERLKGHLDVLFVKPDYFGTTPKACMDGWARRTMLVTPDGLVLPCHAAMSLPLTFARVSDGSLASIWADSPGLVAYRGETWMKEPCKSCDRRTVDFGGCRCQAFALTGDAAAADPACHLASEHALIEGAVEHAHALAQAHAHEDRGTAAPRRYLYRGR